MLEAIFFHFHKNLLRKEYTSDKNVDVTTGEELFSLSVLFQLLKYFMCNCMEVKETSCSPSFTFVLNGCKHDKSFMLHEKSTHFSCNAKRTYRKMYVQFM